MNTEIEKIEKDILPNQEEKIDSTLNEDILPTKEELDSIETEFEISPFTPVNKEKTVVDIRTQYAKDFSKIPLLTEEEEKELFTNIFIVKKELELDKNNKKLKEELTELSNKAVVHNLRLVADNTRDFINKGVPYLDLVQEGNLGLMKAVKKYDISLGYKFSTYAVWWIRQRMSRIIANQARDVRIPVGKYEFRNKISRVEEELTQELMRFPTNEEIASRLGITTEKLIKIKNIYTPILSLDTPIGEDKETLLIDILEPKNSINIEEIKSTEDEYENIALRNVLIKFLNRELPEKYYYDARGKERFNKKTLYVLKQRFGFNEEEREYTLTELAQEFHVTPESIRQIEAKGLKILNKSNNPIGNYLSSYKGVFGTPTEDGKKPKRMAIKRKKITK